MGTTDRSGISRDSTPTGSSALDQGPGHSSESSAGGPSKYGAAFAEDDFSFDADAQARLERLIATDPFADEPELVLSDAEFLQQYPDAFREEEPGSELSDEDVARLIATDPFNNDPLNIENAPDAAAKATTPLTTTAAAAVTAATAESSAPMSQASAVTADESAATAEFSAPVSQASAVTAETSATEPTPAAAAAVMATTATVTETVTVESLVLVVRASVPDLVEAPRPDNPPNAPVS